MENVLKWSGTLQKTRAVNDTRFLNSVQPLWGVMNERAKPFDRF